MQTQCKYKYNMSKNKCKQNYKYKKKEKVNLGQKIVVYKAQNSEKTHNNKNKRQKNSIFFWQCLEFTTQYLLCACIMPFSRITPPLCNLLFYIDGKC